jgi:MoxR-like ATPase
MTDSDNPTPDSDNPTPGGHDPTPGGFDAAPGGFGAAPRGGFGAAPGGHRPAPDASNPALLREQARASLQEALFEMKRVIVGQDAMLERVLVSLLAGGHVLLEGVPGLAKTLTVKTLAQVLGGTFSRVQFTPDLVPADLVGTRVYRPDTGAFDPELGPVFCNFLLADEINRAPAKVQSALLEVMQESQVTIGGTTHPVPSPFLAMATQNPIESEGTYPLPEAQVDRFLMKILVDYPTVGEEAAVVGRSLVDEAVVRECIAIEDLRRYAEAARTVLVYRDVIGYAVSLADATRNPGQYQLERISGLIEYGASPRGPIGLVQAARVLALLRGRGHVESADVHDLAPDVLRHRLVLSYDALSEGVTPDDLLEQVLQAVPEPETDRLTRRSSAA